MNFNEHITKVYKVNEFGGSEAKKTVKLDDGNKYMLKFPDPTRQKDLTLSYINNAISEYIGCKIAESMGLPVQSVILGEYTEPGKRTKIACACKDLRESNEEIYDLERDMLADTDLNKDDQNKLSIILKHIKSSELVNPDDLETVFWNQFVLDALIGNTDRRPGNFGIIYNRLTDKARLCPIYDCGSSLSCLISDSRIRSFDVHRASTVCSVMRYDDGRKIPYKEAMLNPQYDKLRDAIIENVPHINIEKIHSIINDISYISDERKLFYINIIDETYTNIHLPSLEKSLEYKHPLPNKEYNKMKILRALEEIRSVNSDIDIGEYVTVSTQIGSINLLKLQEKMFVAYSDTDQPINIIRINKKDKYLDMFAKTMILLDKNVEREEHNDHDER